jgi:glucan phosphoethanolaminetransferase (alkaline phosphatase superfamily)
MFKLSNHNLKIAMNIVIGAILFIVIDLFLIKNFLQIGDFTSGKRFWINILGSALIWTIFINLLGPYIKEKNAPKIIFFCLVFLVYFIQSAYFETYQKYISIFDLRFFKSDPLMTLELYFDHGNFLKPFFVALAASLLSFWVVKKSQKTTKLFASANLLSSSAVFLFLGVSWLGVTNLQIAPISYFQTSFKTLDIRAGANSKVSIQRPTIEQRAPGSNSPNIIWVIGESLTVDHMSIYGYKRETTPNLKALNEKSLISFTNATAIGSRTMVSVPYLLSGINAVDPHGLIYKQPSIFNYLKADGYTTGLITSQDFQWRNIDKLFVDKDLNHFQQGSDFQSNVSVSIGANDHLVLERGVIPFLEKNKDKKAPIFLVTQMSGSHPPYGKQVPNDLKQFLPESHDSDVNAYDNTVWYTDLYLKKLHAWVNKNLPNTIIFFTSDHGQNISGAGSKFHGDLNKQTIHIPFIVFGPPEILETFKKNKDAPISHTDLYATTLDLINRKPVTAIDGLSLKNKISSNRYRVASSYAVTLHKEPVAALIKGNWERLELDFDKNLSYDAAKDTYTPFKDMDDSLSNLFNRKLNK